MKTLPIYFFSITLVIMLTLTSFYTRNGENTRSYGPEMIADTTLVPVLTITGAATVAVLEATETTYSVCTSDGCRMESLPDTLYNPSK